jgi:hypothetical protein
MITDRFLRPALIGLLIATPCACSSKPDVDAASAPALSAMAHALMASHPSSDTVQYAPAPQGIYDLLDLEEVRVYSEGVYFQTGSFFVQEDGVFVPRDPVSFDPTASGDPHFTHVALDVYLYRSAG